MSAAAGAAQASAIALVQRQLDAYNARDLAALLDCYAPDACQYALPATLLARGRDEIAARMAQRFQDPDLQARLLQRQVSGSCVIDIEQVRQRFNDGLGWIELLCIYQLREGRIASASFAFGNRVS